jgi:catechol 2,3-dioxygenase-like lactoylglutathione lyase family enzyme
MQRVIPALRINDYFVSRAFYEKLGFIEVWRHQFEDGLPVFASLRFDGMEIFLTEHAGDCQPGGLVHFYVPDVDALFEQYRQHQIPIAQTPSNSLGPDLRDMLVIDPDGNRLSFLTPKGRTAE